MRHRGLNIVSLINVEKGPKMFFHHKKCLNQTMKV